MIDAEGNQVGVVSREQALQLAEEGGLDLVEIAPNAEPPVCKIMDFGKFRFEQTKRAHAARRKQKQVQVKEVKFRPGTEEADYQVKLRNLRRFIEEGNKAKVTMRFRGREMAHQELGLELLDRVEQDLGDTITIEQRPKVEGRLMVMMIAPKR